MANSGGMGFIDVEAAIKAAQKAAADRAAAATPAQANAQGQGYASLFYAPPPSTPSVTLNRGNGISSGDIVVSSGSTGSSSTPASPSSASPPAPAPVLPIFKPMAPNSKNFKMAPIDTIQFDDSNVEIAMITDLLFEDIGATELANISRSDLIDGQPVVYSPIKNLPQVRREFNSNNIIATAHNTDYFSRFGIDLFAKGIHEPYFNNDGDLVIEIDNVSDEEEIQVQILTNGTIDRVDDV